MTIIVLNCALNPVDELKLKHCTSDPTKVLLHVAEHAGNNEAGFFLTQATATELRDNLDQILAKMEQANA
ncbi:hypothetical protein Q9295_10225 [Xinfangfangia sp. CPCC 101601]|uniref:Uncharacterized protein n=1 Tax=Pseudogemmobacter lacusdianii TaxID=3069608 RepID=A0ABU0VYB8_9RHOB|nr:hypothetical protein [Xinfangfangia sp. CPCC 101601]MDQ2066754.1 hypothetical protein [Xinfangfangia sp. CPCC 101601]